MDSKEKTKRHFNSTAADYNNSGDGKFVQPMYETLVQELSKLKGGKVLDAGCGTGNLFMLLKKEEYRFYGVDLSENMIAAAKKTCSNLDELYVADAEKLPFESDMFDVLVCNASFHHYTHPDTVLDEMNRVAKPGGMLLIGDPYMPQPIRWLMNVLTKFSDEGDFRYYGIHEMKCLLEAHGFEIMGNKHTGHHTVLYTAMKNKISTGGRIS